MDSYLILWIVLATLFAVVELATMAFVALYLALGAAAAAVVAAFDGSVALQMLAFVATGILLMVLTRPVIKRRLESPTIHTNVSTLLGKSAIVTIAIDNDSNTGQVRVGSEYWTARTAEAEPAQQIAVGARVRVETVEGVTARVVAIADPA